MKRYLSFADVAAGAHEIALDLFVMAQEFYTRGKTLSIWGVPRGGVSALYLVLAEYRNLPGVKGNALLGLHVTEKAPQADVFIDDLVDSGKTRDLYLGLKPKARFMALIEKGKTDGFPLGEWLVFPWEETAESSASDIFVRLLQFIGEDPEREGLKETPARCVKAWGELTCGYSQDPVAILKTFEDGGENYDELVHVANIPFHSLCEHHLAPFFGTVAFGYIPRKRIVGLSKMNRLVECFARRLQVQERLTSQVIDTFCTALDPIGVGCIIRARHLCMESRGVGHQGCITTTSAFRGVFKGEGCEAARAEFLALTRA